MPYDAVHDRSSFDATMQIGGNQLPQVNSRFTRARSMSTNGIQNRLAQPPRLPNDQYRNDLRYQSDRQSQRKILQSTVDRLTQKNVSRNVKEILTTRNRFQKERSVWDGTKATKGNVGINLPKSSLKQISSHRDRHRIAQSLHGTEIRLQQIEQKSAGMRDDEYQFSNEVTKHDILRQLDAPREFKKTFCAKFVEQFNRECNNPDDRIHDNAHLGLKIQNDPRVRNAFDEFFGAKYFADLSQYHWDKGNYDLAEKYGPKGQFRERNRELDEAEDRFLREDLHTRFSNSIDSAIRDIRNVLTVVNYQIDSLEEMEHDGTATAQDRLCLGALQAKSIELNQAAQAFESAVSNVSGNQNHNAHLTVQQQLSAFNQKLTGLENHWQQFRTTIDKLNSSDHSQVPGQQKSLQSASSQLAGQLESSQQKRKVKGQRLQVLGQVLSTAFDHKVIALATGGGLAAWRAERSQRKALLGLDTSNQADNRKTIAYSEILAAAAKNGLELGDLPRLGSVDAYRGHLQQLDPATRNEIFGRVDQRLASWKKEYKQHAESLRAKWKITQASLSVKHWFQNSELRKKSTEVGAFSTETVLAQGEVREAVSELTKHDAEEPRAEHDGHTEVHSGGDHGGSEHAETGDAEAHKSPTTEVFVAKDVLHGLAIVKNVDDMRRIQEEIDHKKHLRHEAHHKLEHYEHQKGAMSRSEKYRSGVAKHCYKKIGKQSIALDRTEQVVALTQILRHGTSASVDVIGKAGVVGHGLTYAGAGGAFGGAAAEFSEGIIGTGKAFKKGITASQLKEREQTLQTKIEQSHDPQEIRELKFQLQTVRDLRKQQKVGRNVVSALKGFGMAAGYTLVGLIGVGVVATGMAVAAPVLLGAFAVTAVGLAIYKKGKDTHENWKINRTEDLILGRGGDAGFLHSLQREAQEKGMSVDAVALMRAARGKSVADKQPTSTQMLQQLKRQTRDARLNDVQAEALADINDQIEAKEEQLTQSLTPDQRRELTREIEELESQKSAIEAPFRQRLMESSTAKTLRDAYKMSEDEIFAIVNSPDTDTYDELGARLISEYHQRLTE